MVQPSEELSVMGERYYSPREVALLVFERTKNDWNLFNAFMDEMSEPPGFLANLHATDRQFATLFLKSSHGIPLYRNEPLLEVNFRAAFEKKFGVRITSGEVELLQQITALVKPFALQRKLAELSRKTVSKEKSERAMATNELEKLREYQLPKS